METTGVKKSTKTTALKTKEEKELIDAISKIFGSKKKFLTKAKKFKKQLDDALKLLKK